MENLGRILFVAGLLIAILLGLDFTSAWGSWLPWLLAVIGALVGYLNVSKSETSTFLIGGIALALSANVFSDVPALGGTLTMIMTNIMTFVSGAIFVVAIQALYSTGKE